MTNVIKTLKWLLIIGVFGSLIIPFLFGSDLFFPFITVKAYSFRILVEVLFGLWIILAIFDPAYRPKKSWIVWSFITFLVVILIANLQGIDFVKSFWSNYERMEGYITLLHLFAYFLVAACTLNSSKLWNIFWNYSIVLSVVHAGYALLQKAGVLEVGLSADRIDGTFGNAIYLGVFMLFHVFLTLFYLLKHKGKSWIKYLYILAIILQIIVIFLTATRGAILALIGGLVLTFLLIAILEPQKKALRKVTIGVVAASVLFGIFIFGFKDSSAVRDITPFRRLSEISFDSGTVLARFINWGIAWEASQEKFLLGYGQGNYGPIFDKHYDPRMWDQEQWFDRVHNIVFDWLIAGGLLGLLSYLSLFAAILYYIWRKDWNSFSMTEKSVLTAMLVAYFFHNLFVFDNLTSYMMFALVLAFIHSESTRRSGGELQEIKIRNSIAIPAGLIVLIAIPFSAWAINADSYRQNKEMIEALRSRNSVQEVVESLDHFETSLAYDTFGNTETRQQLISMTSRVLSSSAIDVEVKKQFVNLAANEIQKEIDERPDNARFLIIAGQLLAQTGNYEIALEFFQNAVDASPNKQFVFEPVVNIFLRLERNEDAIQIAKDAYLINTESDKAWRVYIRAAIESGNTDLYDSLIKEAFDTGNGYRVVQISLENLNNDPENVQAWASVAIAYYQNGQKEEALNVLKELSENFPEAKSQADDLIEQIEAGEEIL